MRDRLEQSWLSETFGRVHWLLPVAVVLVLLLFWAVGVNLPRLLGVSCKDVHLLLALPGDPDAVLGGLRDRCGNPRPGTVMLLLLADMPFALAYGWVLHGALVHLWPTAWRTAVFLHRSSLVFAAPLAAAAFDLLENGVLLAGFASASSADQLGLAGWAATTSTAFGWWKFILVFLSLSAFITAALGTYGFRRMCRHLGAKEEPLPPATGHRMGGTAVPRDAAKPPNGTAICLSGGGIRAASFALGGLQGLDQGGLFVGARYLAAVSGGAYTALAWRVARETADRAHLVQPQRTTCRDRILDPDAGVEAVAQDPAPAGDTASGWGRGSPNLYEHVRRNRRYLATGRGGSLVTAALIVGFLVVNIAVLVLGLYLVAFPVGVFAALSYVVPELRECGWAAVCAARPAAADLSPPAVLAALVAGGCLVGAFLTSGRLHAAFMKSTAIAIGAAVAVWVLLMGVPLGIAYAAGGLKALNELVDAVRVPTGGVLGALAGLGLGGALLGVAVRPLGKAAPRLGGVLLAGVALLLGSKMAADAAFGQGFWHRGWGYAAGVVIMGCVYYGANLRWWSLHRIYLRRLRSTFSTMQAEIGGERRVIPRPWADERSWPSYQDGSMPELLICASAQRQDRTGTGIPAVSFVFSPAAVTLYDHRLGDDGELVVQEYSTPSGRYAEALQGVFDRHLVKPSAATAMSGAAVTSAMGRFNFGSTNALLAALNVRLGVWMPNPRYIQRYIPEGTPMQPFKRTRLNYLVKELLGVYDLDDPYAYVTDGGHWENLGLVELLRRRVEHIFCVDASGDPPGTAATLREALVLAEVECGVTVQIDKGLERLVPDLHTRLADDCVAVGVIRYHRNEAHARGAWCLPDDCHYGQLYFAKAAMSPYAPESVRAYALQDRRFPGYSTADQFLGQIQFDRLVGLGRAATQRAAQLHEQLNEALESGATVNLDPALYPACEELYRLRGLQ